MKAIRRGIEWVVLSAFGLLTLMAIIQVVSRYVFRYPLGWTAEASQILLVWSVFMSIPVLAARHGFLRVDALVSALPRLANEVVELLASLVSAAFLLWLTWLGFQLAASIGNQTTSVLGISYSYVYLSLPVGCALGAVYLVTAGATRWAARNDSRTNTTAMGADQSVTVTDA